MKKHNSIDDKVIGDCHDNLNDLLFNKYKFRVNYQNVRGLNSKTKQFYLSCLSCDYDLISLTETWLKKSVFDCELFSSNYVVYRSDRSELNSLKGHGGGVLIAVKSKYQSERLSFTNESEVEIVAVKVCVSHLTLYVCCVYVPSNSDRHVYELYSAAIDSFINSIPDSINNIILLVGDFNFSHVEWLPDVDNENIFLPVNISNCNNVAAEFIDSCFNHGLFQLNNLYNFNGRVLDLVFCSEYNSVSIFKCETPLSKIDIHHIPFDLYLELPVPLFKKKNVTSKYNFKKADWKGLNEYFLSTNWLYLFDSCDIDTCLDYFYNVVCVAIDCFVPRIIVKKSSRPIWYSSSLRKIKNLKTRAFKIFKRTKLTSDYIAFTNLRNRFTQCQKMDYKKYMYEVQQNLTTNPNMFWSYVNTKKSTCGYPAVMKFKNDVSSDNLPICELFANYFSEVYVSDDVTLSQNGFGLTSQANLGYLNVSIESVLSAMLNIDVNKGAGSDPVPPSMVVNCAQTLVVPLHYIYNLSLSAGIFPKIWKMSYIIPIFKSGSRCDVSNYRGISILPTLGKLFESLVTDSLFNSLSNVISVSQHGFCSKRSTITNLTEFTNFAIKTVENKSQLDVIYTDFSKAFDRLSHKIIIRKLFELGVHSSMLSWLQSYLSNRTQCVNVLSSMSKTFSASSGVPQGSHLGPFLFIIFVNDLAEIFQSCKCLMYADDVKLYLPVNSLNDAIALQNDIDLLTEWCNRNYMFLNVNKCKVMNYHRKNRPLKFSYCIGSVPLVNVSQTCDLGVNFVSNLSFSKHIELIVSKAKSMLGFLKRICYEFKNKNALKSIYCAHVRSHLEYACIVWSPNVNLHVSRIESVQKQFVLYALRDLYVRDSDYVLPPYIDRCAVLNLKSLSERRNNLGLFFMFDVLTGFVDAPNILALIDFNVPMYRFRVNDLIRTHHHRTAYGESDPLKRLAKSFNDVLFLFDFNVSRCKFRNDVNRLPAR